MTSVAVLGGGVAGLSAAHELAERGFSVTVYEQRDAPGGKARSIPYAGSGTGGRADLPGEHGFRFFPGFYRHLPDTMSRIPAGGGTVRDRLVGAMRILFAQAAGKNEIFAPAHAPESIDDVVVLMRFLREAASTVGVPAPEYAVLVERLLTLLTSCDERRYEQWELQSWWEYTGAEKRSEAFQRFLADGLTRTLVAARGREMSARTGGLMLVQLLQDLSRAGGRADRVLNAPTSEAWIDPWVAFLRGRGVDVQLSSPVEGITVSGGRVTGATVAGRTVTADHYLAALPVEVMRALASPALRAAEPRLNGLDRLVTRWMNGVLFYLDRDVPLVKGHAIYVDSEWALTSVSQKQFWPGVDLADRGDGRTRGILSVDVSEWQRPGRRTVKVAQRCTREEIFDEVWGQVTDHLDGGELDGVTVVDRFLDPAIVFPNPTEAGNLEPLLVNTAGSWAARPDAVTAIPNLFLASDYVRTHTDLATMEAANEAARRAVNGILEASGSTARRCAVWKLQEPGVFAAARAVDRVRWKLFRRGVARSPFTVAADGTVAVRGVVGRALLGASRLRRRTAAG
jgi:uncharacterized protein with NAD-binding domain and iron-sulfur cluster